PVVPRMGIEVSSQGSEAITDEDGRFTLTGLSVPYDLTTVDQTTDYVHVYAGLTTPTPRVSGMDGVVLPSTDRSSDVMGDLTGDLLPLESGEKLIVCVEPLDWISGVCATVEG